MGTTGSSFPLAASMASFHLAVHKHHLQPDSSPILRRLLPREAEKSRNSLVRTPWMVVSFASGTGTGTGRGVWKEVMLDLGGGTLQ